MIELVEANWHWFLIVLLLGIAVAWFVFVGTRRTTVTREGNGEDAGPATRNQALIDSPPVAAVPPASPMGVAGAGTVAAAAVQEAAAKAAPDSDDLTRIKGVGPKLAALLNELGISQLAQIAAWTDADIERIDAQLGRFEGRIRRDDWVSQAQLLVGGDTQRYEDKFGKL